MLRVQTARAEKKAKELQKRNTIKAAKAAAKAQRESSQKTSIKDLLGGQLWFEEKLKRSKEGGGHHFYLDDDELERQIMAEWNKEDDSNSSSRDEADLDSLDEVLDSDLGDLDPFTGENEDGDGEVFDPNEYYDEEEEYDIVEVYDETGELVATYDAAEYEKMRSAR